MTPNEFKAWLDGFLHDKTALDAAQIDVLKAKAAISGPPSILPPSPFAHRGFVSGGTYTDQGQNMANDVFPRDANGAPQ